MSNTFH